MKKITLLSALCACVVLIVVLLQASFSSTSLNLLPATHGVYAREPQADFVWTSSQVVFNMPVRSGPSAIDLRLSAGLWPDRPTPSVTLLHDGRMMTRWQPSDAPRHYLLLLPPYSSQLTLESDVARPPQDDPRFLGLRLYSAELLGTGFAFGQALALGMGMILIALITLVLRLAFARGWALPVAVTLVALGLRLLGLEHVPAGFFQDEAVSIVDANSLLQTGRDHYGVWMPLGAFEAFGDWVSPLLTYVQLPFVLMFGTSPLAARLPAALAGALAVPALYVLARTLTLLPAAALLAVLAAAVSPWQILRSRIASPPALVPLCWILCLWAGVVLIQQRNRRAALVLALASGFGLYSYPTMKLAVPFLTASAIVLAALPFYAGKQRSAWAASTRTLLQDWWPAALLLTVLWLPFVQLTLFNPNSSMRASRKILQAETASAWLLQWLDGYSRYFRPEFYFLSGDAANGISAQGVELGIEALLVLPGLALLLYLCSGKRGMLPKSTPQSARLSALLVLMALLIAPLPASLMAPNPHLTRALIMAPMFALLVGMGSWLMLEFLQRRGLRARHASALLMLLLGASILGQGLGRFEAYYREYPAQVARKYQDGMREAAALLVQQAGQYDAVWVDDSMPFPYIYVLAAGGVSPQETQATLLVDHPGTTFNTVHRVGNYAFRSLKAIPYTLPTIAATVNSLGEPGYVLQVWEQDGQRILLLRRMIR